MWYMQPCCPDLRAIRFWRVFTALSAFGPENRTTAAKAAKQIEWNLNG
jgi:hypothetical protein